MNRIALVLMALALLGCGDKAELERLQTENTELKESVAKLEKDIRSMRRTDAKMNYLTSRMEGLKARIVTDFGNMEFSLLTELAPIHCFAFAARAESGFYDNLAFHRVMKGFMIQGGDPNSRDDNPYDDGLGGSILKTPHEFNNKTHGPGVLSAARVPDKSQGAGTQFFVVHREAPHLDQDYTVFGEMISGKDVLEKIANVELLKGDQRLQNRPAKTVRIKTIEVYYQLDQ